MCIYDMDTPAPPYTPRPETQAIVDRLRASAQTLSAALDKLEAKVADALARYGRE